MNAQQVFSEQIRKLTAFIYILLILFTVNVVEKLYMPWQGMSIIVTIYLYVFSFYLIFNFSSIDLKPLKEEYRRKYGKSAVYRLFFMFRIVPFAFVYCITAVSILINYLDRSNWPWRPVLELLDGRFSNIVFYSLILLVVLKLRRGPRFTIPLFFFMSLIYFLIYRLVYSFSPVGITVSSMKLFQVVMGLFFLVFEFFFDRKNILKSVAASLAAGLVFYGSLIGIFYSIFTYSEFATYQQVKSAKILLKMGYSFPLKKVRRICIETTNLEMLYHLVYYSVRYDKKLVLSTTEWENLFLSGDIDSTDVIAGYIWHLEIWLPYDEVIAYMERESINAGEKLIESEKLITYASEYYDEYREDIMSRMDRGNRYLKIWGIKVMAESGSVSSIPYLVDTLTGIDEDMARAAYRALVQITGLDPAKTGARDIQSPDVIVSFMTYYNTYTSLIQMKAGL